MKLASLILLVVVLAVFLTPLSPLYAAGSSDNAIGPGAIQQKLQSAGQPHAGAGTLAPQSSPVILAGRIVRGALVLIGVVFFALMIYGGSLYLTAGGNEEQVKKAVHVLTRAVIGIVIVLLAGAITQFLVGNLARSVAPPGTTAHYVPADLPGGCSHGTYTLYAEEIGGPACLIP